jgi:trans-AT polyketide synthase/acyltransferase/oxidoreductase domain-containing protein
MKAILFPGQGAQFKGMGRELFKAYPRYAEQASKILGYSIEELCLEDPDGRLRLTQFTQPALFVVNALGYKKLLDDGAGAPDYLAGHSLGEFNALMAAEVFDFETGLRLVQKRGELMGAAGGGAMAAVLGISPARVREILDQHDLSGVDLANFNTPTQVVIAGTTSDITAAQTVFDRQTIRCVVLNVSAPFHSRHMRQAQTQFAQFLDGFSYGAPKIPVIANVTARPYAVQQLKETLGAQIASPVQWIDTVRYLMGKDVAFTEVGVTNVLTKMVNEIKTTETPLVVDEAPAPHVPAEPAAAEPPAAKVSSATQAAPVAAAVIDMPVPAASPAVQAPTLSTAQSTTPSTAGAPDATIGADAQAYAIAAHALGSPLFRQRFGLKYAYVAGAMYRGVASADLVVRMGRAGLLGFFGSGGLSLEQIETALRSIQSRLGGGEPFGMNLLANYGNPPFERATIDLYMKYGVRFVEAAAFMQITPSLALFRLRGLRRGADGSIVSEHRIMAKVSRPEVAQAFMSPCPPHVVQQLLAERAITPEQAELAKLVPMSEDICVEADSGGHTDGGIASVIFPAMLRLRERMMATHGYRSPICIGLAGGIGAPEAAAAAFIMGADFIVTGSINQCTVDAGITDHVKNLLQDINVQDTDYAPAGDMFEMGAKVQVLKKGVFFPARANKLFSLYSNYNSLDELPEKVKNQLQTSFFKKTFNQIWDETKDYLNRQGLSGEIAKAEANPKQKMALVFRWYFGYSTNVSFNPAGEDRVNCQVHTGPALGAFNQWVKGSALESWTKRHADEIGQKMMTEAALHLSDRLHALTRAVAA